MVLGIDLRCLPADGSEGAGIAHAARELTRALLLSVPKEWTIRCYLPRGSRMNTDTDTDTVILSGSRRHDLIKGLNKSPCDILFVPSGAVALNLPVPAIPWVHDLDIYKHPEWFGESWFTRIRTTWMFKKGLIKAPMIFAVSEYTGKEIGDLRPEIRRERIFVTGEGGDETFLKITDEDRIKAKERLVDEGITDQFILMLGTVEPRKNIPFALSVLRRTTHEQRRTLIIAGRDGWKTGPINLEIEHASKDHSIIRLKDVSDELRRDLLISASIVFLPSLSEGFGLVALEAIQAGIPVIASDRGALPEIVGDTAISLENPNAWKLAITRLQEDDAFRNDWIERQKQMVSAYSWKRPAEVIWNQLRGLNPDVLD